jgi:hypothetical protein
MADKVFAFSWNDAFTRLHPEPLGTVAKVHVSEIPHPRDAGMRRIESKGEDQRPQYVRILDERLACHVLVCGEWYRVRLYEYRSAQLAQTPEPEVLDRNEAPIRHRERRPPSLAALVADNPGPTVGAAAAFGALLGAALASKKQRAKAAAAGASIGATVGLAMVAIDTANTSPRTSEVAQGLFATLASAGAGRPTSRIIRLSPPSRPTSAPRTASKTKPKVKAKKKTSNNGTPV